MFYSFCTVYFRSFCSMGVSRLQKARRRPGTMGHCCFCSHAFYRIADLLSAPFGNQDDLFRLRTANFSKGKILSCLTGFIVSAAAGKGINTNVASNARVWNLGMINMNYNAYADDVWKLDFKSASEGFVKEQSMTIADSGTQQLYADISCNAVPDKATLVLWLVQKDVAKSIDVTNLSEPLEYPLNEFENGKIYVRLQINGVENTVSEIYIQ